MPYICRWVVGKPARLIIRLLFGFASDSNSVFDKLNQSTNSETAMLSSGLGKLTMSCWPVSLLCLSSVPAVQDRSLQCKGGTEER